MTSCGSIFKRLFALGFCFSFSGVCIANDAAKAASKDAAKSAPTAVPANESLPKSTGVGETRVLKFPADVAVGDLFIGKTGRDPGSFMYLTGAGAAKGTVTVSVPAGQSLLLVLSKGAFSNPESLKDISVQGVDVLRVSYYAMDDKDQSVCNRVMKFLPRFKNLQFLDIDRSDTTDADLAGIKELSKLRGVGAFMSGLRGDCFKYFCELPKFTSLNVDRCPITEANLSFLPGLPQLADLSISRIRMSEAGLKEVALCRSLTDLSVANNKIDDNALKILLSLRNLKTLDLRGTNVTLDGLAVLKPLSLTKISLPKKGYPADQIAKVQLLFPHAKVSAWSSSVKAEDKVIFAPLR